MNVQKSECIKILDALTTFTDRHELEGQIYDLLIGADAQDAKIWYGAGSGILASTDMAIAFVNRMGFRSYSITARGSSNSVKADILTPHGTFDGIAYAPAVALIRALFYYLLDKASRRGRSTTDAG